MTETARQRQGGRGGDRQTERQKQTDAERRRC